MFTRLHLQIRQSVLWQRLLWTLLILFVYFIGRTIPLMTVPMDQLITQAETTRDWLSQLSTVTGGEFNQLTLFTLGLSPWMTSMIFWRFLMFFERFKHLTQRQSQNYRLLLTLLVASLQAFSLTASLTFLPLFGADALGQWLGRGATILLMVTGAFALMWLAERNAAKGLGGPSVMILANMLLLLMKTIYEFFDTRFLLTKEVWQWLGSASLLVIALVSLTIVTYRAEYRIHIRRINIISRFSEQTYLPIRLNPAGGMPFMYGMTLMMLPPVLLKSLQEVFPQWPVLSQWASQLALTRLPGILTYTALLYILTIAFAYFNYDPPEIAKTMRENGDYIEHIRPGVPTSRYINEKLLRLAQIGALPICLLGAVPLLVILGQPQLMNMALMVNHVYIISSLMMNIIEQVTILQSWKRYGDIL